MTRRSPASASGRASARSAEPFVVRVRSSARPVRGAAGPASMAIRSGRSRRTSGSPPVIRSFSTPSPTNARASRVDLLEAQHLVLWQELVIAPEDLPGHAVGAPEVAAIGHRDPQIAQRPAERVGHAGTAVEPVCLEHRAMVAREPDGIGRRRRTVPPAQTAGTSSQLHRTPRRCNDASTHRRSGPPVRPSRQRGSRPMASTETRPSFRLPWSTGPAESDEHRPDRTDELVRDSGSRRRRRAVTCTTARRPRHPT